MSKVSLMLVVIAVGSSLSQVRAAEPAADSRKPQPAASAGLIVKDVTNLYRSIRIVKDLAEFDILKLRRQHEGAWIVAEIRPGGLSGALHNQGAYIQAETGKVIDSGIRPSHVILVGGQWKRLQLLNGQAPAEGRYEWKAPYRDHSFDRNFNVYDLYSVFTGKKNNGTVICQFFKKRSGAKQFSSVTAIPNNWKTSVKPAYESHVKHAAELDGHDLKALRQLAAGDNPFIALTAIRQILNSSTTDDEQDRLVQLALSAPKYRQAVLTALLLKRKDSESRNIVPKAISRSTKRAQLTGIALGLEAATPSRGRILPNSDPIQKLRLVLVEKWRNLGNPDPANDYQIWNRILTMPDIEAN